MFSYFQGLYLLNNEWIMPLLKKYMEDTSGYHDTVGRPAAYLETITVEVY
jgi:hypothetical protein